MTNRTLNLDDRLYQYLLSVSLRETETMAQLRQETADLPGAQMQIAPEQGQFMALVVQLIGAKKALEVGVFTGYSALWVAQALPAQGRLIACDINEESSRIARRYWEQAGIADRIDLRLGPAVETLEQLLGAGEANTFDFAFIDADKANYPRYYEQALQLVRPGGVIVIDNVLWSGRVADPDNQESSTATIRHLNTALHQDDRVSLSLVPIGDGITLAMKRG